MNLNNKNVLIFCPFFFNYHSKIKNEFERQGANVILFNERIKNSFWNKALIRINKNLIKSQILDYYNQCLNSVDVSIDFIFFVNPEALFEESIQTIKSKFPKSKLILYMWDSFLNKPKIVKLLPFFDTKFTFDPDDAKKYSLKLLPLFYTNEFYVESEIKENRFDLNFIGTGHSDRVSFVKKLMKQVAGSHFVYFYLQSPLIYFYFKILDKNFVNNSLSDFHFKSLNPTIMLSNFKDSKYIVDVNHPLQKGLTIRTLEALGTKKKLITTNKDITQYDFYDKNNILVVDRTNPVISRDFLELPYRILPEEIYLKYSLAHWVQSLFVELENP